MAITTTDNALVTVTCGECDLEFGMPRFLYDARRIDRHIWFCPVGHQRCFIAKSEVQELRELLADAQARAIHANDQKHAALAEVRKAQAKAKRVAKRAAAGVCPCCTRSFTNMARHMKTKHPDYEG